MAADHQHLILQGGPALSGFQSQQLADRLASQGLPGPVAAHYFYVAQLAVEQAAATRDGLVRLLGDVAGDLAPDQAGLVVIPRLGTLSPWSSKAEDIARNCGLAGLLRLERGVLFRFDAAPSAAQASAMAAALHDPMTETVVGCPREALALFDAPPPGPLRRVEFLAEGVAALQRANRDWGLALSAAEIDYLAEHYAQAGRNPSDAELVMFAQINSEHCRHKIFNADWTLDGETQPHSLFQMIKASHAASPTGVLSAYKDNASVVEGHLTGRFFPQADRRYALIEEPVHLLMKVETHNHPTAIAPDPGAATGAGGEIRDEAATGRGSRTKAGLCGFSVSNLAIPGAARPWEVDHGRPERVASALDIMLEGPIGAARYNNEFGRPNLAGYFRSFQMDTHVGLRGYHKPIMIAGGMGNIRADHVEKRAVEAGARLIVLGGPAMRIGLGGGAASSMASGASTAALDFASVQRANPELERRCQEVIDGCWALGDGNPIASIHDVGAGGLSNALPEIIDADGRGGTVRLRDIQSADASLSPMEIWCNESQERYVLAVDAADLPAFEALCARERCPYAVVGEATLETGLSVIDSQSQEQPVDLPMPVLLGKTPGMHRTGRTPATQPGQSLPADIDLRQAAYRVLRLPSVAEKGFLVTIGDRSIGGQVAREQMVGPWQVPVADCAVTTTGFTGVTGEAMAMGERSPLALLDAPASGRMAVGEALTNIAAARIERLSDIRLSANWMAACGDEEEDARLFRTVRAVGAELCPALGICIPVGKDSLSMRSLWETPEGPRDMRAPVSLIVSAFAPVSDAGRTLTPQLRLDAGPTRLIAVDLGRGQHRLGGSALAQVYNCLESTPPDLDDPDLLRGFFECLQRLTDDGAVLAYHDRSDGGLLATLVEMAFAGRSGLDIDLAPLGGMPMAALFTEELGAVLQVPQARAKTVCEAFEQVGVPAHVLGEPTSASTFRLRWGDTPLLTEERVDMHRAWAETSHEIKNLRDNPDCALEEFEALLDDSDPGLPARPAFDPDDDPAAPYLNLKRPRVAILREQGVNGHVEMAWAFHAAGFEAVDVHMTELHDGQVDLEQFSGLAACGGFSYGDVLGAGRGWAANVLYHEQTRAAFARFFENDSRFALGVCNGCQMLSNLAELIPGTEDWPRFHANRSAQFEGRTAGVEIMQSPAVLLDGMAGSKLPIAVAHGEGRVVHADEGAAARLAASNQLALRYVDGQGQPAERYPANPNGSPGGATGFCNADGRVLILMPHPERVTRSIAQSWRPDGWGERAPWARLFSNARRFVG